MPGPSPRVSRPLAAGAALSLFAMLLGFGLGGVFGANEGAVKGRLSASADAVMADKYDNDGARAQAVVSKSWNYLKRAHMHWGAMGGGALALIAFLSAIGGAGKLGNVSALSVGAGALLYGLFWLAAGFAAPGLGGTAQAKQAYEFVAVPGAGLSLVGVVAALAATVRELARPR